MTKYTAIFTPTESYRSLHGIIFTFTAAEAEWAATYSNNHKNKKVKILAPTIPAQLVLRKHGLPYLDYFSPELYTPSDYSKRTKTQIEKAKKISNFFLEKMRKEISIVGIPLVSILQNIFEWEFLSTIHAYNLYVNIEKKWKPQYYLIPASLHLQGVTGTTDPQFSAAALIANVFAHPKKIKRFHVIQSHNMIVEQIQWITERIFPLQLFFRKLFVLCRRKIDFVQQFLLQPRLQKTDVLFYSFGFNLDYYHRFFSCIRENTPIIQLKTLTGVQPLDAEWILRRRHIPFISLKSLRTKNDVKKISKETQRIKETINHVTLSMTKRYFPANLPASLHQALRRKSVMILKSHGTKFIEQSILAQKALQKFSPKLFITTHDPAPSTTPFVYCAKKMRIQTLVLLHGVIGNGLSENHQSTHAAVWGPWTKQRYISVHHKPSSTIHPIGFPMLDPVLQSKDVFWKRKKAANISFSSPVRFSMLLCQYLPDSFILSKFLDEIFSIFARDNSAYSISIRTHRDQNHSGFSNLAMWYGLKINLNENIPLDTFVRESDIVLSMDTTAILWPMIYGKPLFCTTPWWGDWYLPVKKYNAAWIPRSKESLQKKLNDLLKNPTITNELHRGQKKFLEHYLGELDGRSSERLLHLIRHLLTASAR